MGPVSDVSVGQTLRCLPGGSRRIGEASHPPFEFLLVIPRGSEGKSSSVRISSLKYTATVRHLSCVTQPSACNTLRSQMPAPRHHWLGLNLGRPMDRSTDSDYASRSIQISLPPDLFETGRIQATHHQVGVLPVLCANIYGYPSGPTHPQALMSTEAILEPLTKELVLGRSGPCLIAGDFNQSHEALPQIQVWIHQGWSEVQLLAQHRWLQPVCPTCKNATHRDMLWVSPELAAMLQSVELQDIFQEHSTVIASFSVPDCPQTLHVWQLPSEIPWPHVDEERLAQQATSVPLTGQSTTQWVKDFSSKFEAAFTGCVKGLPGARLPTSCMGRGPLFPDSACRSQSTG